MKRKILVIGYVWPEPNSSAAGAHMLSLLKLFRQQGWRVVFASPAQTTPHMTDLTTLDIESIDILLNDTSFDHFAAELNPELVIFDRFMMEEQFSWRVERSCPDALRLLDTEDLQCLRYARQQAHREQRAMCKQDLFSDLAKREIAAILRSDLTLIISDYEMQLLQQTFNLDPALLHHLPFMPDPATQLPVAKSFSERQHFVVIGNFRHAPNWDSVLFLQQIWPLIRQRLPAAELHIYGAYPPKKATSLNNPDTGFLVKGWAEDAFAVLSEARVCVAPLRFGAGIKGKLMDAMRVATPSVTTDIGAEGMTGNLPWPGVIANSAADIADAAVRLYENKSLWLNAQQQIHPILRRRYDTKQLGQALLERIDNTSSCLTQQRLDNFTGAMLRHHMLKSTQYMSRWIESKNELKKLQDTLEDSQTREETLAE